MAAELVESGEQKKEKKSSGWPRKERI